MMSFSITNMIVVLVVLASVTWGGHLLSGRAQTSSSFFTADGALPWWAVSASLYATVLSAVSFVSLPATVFGDGGNMTFIQILLGLACGKVAMALLFVRAYYDSKTIDTVYDYLTVRLSGSVAKATMILQILLLLAQNSIVVLSAALVLNVLTDISIGMSCLIIVGFSILWSWMGGVRTVIWTDAMLFGVMVAGAVLCAALALYSTNMTIGAALQFLDGQAKLKLIELSMDPSKAYTLWTGLITGTLFGMIPISSQSGLQRIRACRSVSDARKAFLFSAILYITPILLLITGLGLSLFYGVNGVPDDLATRLETQPDQVFPYFIVNEIPNGLSGVLVAALFAAAISTLDSRLAELSEITLVNIYKQYIRVRADESHYLRAARMFLLIWGGIFGLTSFWLSKIDGQSLIDLNYLAANALAGPILGVFFLARFGIGSAITATIGAVISVAVAIHLHSSGVTHYWWLPVSVAIIIILGWLESRQSFDRSGVVAARS